MAGVQGLEKNNDYQKLYQLSHDPVLVWLTCTQGLHDHEWTGHECTLDELIVRPTKS